MVIITIVVIIIVIINIVKVIVTHSDVTMLTMKVRYYHNHRLAPLNQ